MGKLIRHLEQCVLIICKARSGGNDIWMNSLPPNSDSTPSLSSFKDLMEEERLGDTGGFWGGGAWDDWSQRCPKRIQAPELQRGSESFSPDRDPGPRYMGLQSSYSGFRDEDLASHSHLPHSRKWLTLHPATHTYARSHLQFLSPFPLKFYSSVGRGCPNLKMHLESGLSVLHSNCYLPWSRGSSAPFSWTTTADS